ncbi:MAG TPA: cellulase family glycosylhydrolase [Polyangiaceae bacterium]|nr:cellulase family glycosylhydrolase [Polyangiaceae bacterium]
MTFRSRLRGRARLGLFAACVGAGCAAPHTPPARSASQVAVNAPTNFELDGKPFCFVGANNYYLAYAPHPMVDDVLESARAMGVKVVRTWGFIDRGSLDGRVRSIDGDGTKRGFYFQAWDPLAKRAIFNDGPNGLSGLDYALAKAGQLGLKLVLVLTNNWPEFGGMDQYLAWFGLSTHSDFYRDARVRQAYRAYLEHLALRVNGITNRVYREDPTIFAWELANEPRGSVGTPSGVVTGWAGEMSSYLKSIDPNHLVAVGDEGFLDGESEHWTYHADNGIDHRALTALPNVDYGTYHLYPEAWGTGFGWSERWLDDHLRVARELGKPSVLEEYGLTVTRDRLGRVSDGLPLRLENYRAWNERVLAHGGNAAMFWLLVGRDSEHGGVYPDYDRFSVYRGDETADLLSRFARRFAENAPACADAGAAGNGLPSAFVRVRRQTKGGAVHADSD